MLNSKVFKPLATFCLLTTFVAGAASAQDPSITLSTASGQPAESVSIDFTFVSEGTSDAGFQFVMSDETVFSSINLSNCLAGNNAVISSCVIPGSAPDTIRITLANDPTTPLVDFVGTIVFTIDGAASAPQTVDLVWDQAFTNTTPAANVTHNDGAVEIVSGPPAVLDVTPPSINFGNVISPGTATETVTIANSGTAGAPDLDVTALTFSDAAFSAAGGTCGAPTFSLSAGSSCTVDVEFSAAAVQSYLGDLDVVSSVGTEIVALEGEGTAGPVAGFDIDPPTAAFGTVDLNNMPQSIVHTITNDGDPGSTLELNDLSYSGDPEFGIASGCPATLAQGASCEVTVTFDSAANGSFTGTVTAVTNVGTFEVPVSGEADSVPALDVTPPFGPVNLGNGSAGSILTAAGQFSNTGSADGDVSCNLSGPDAGIFSVNPSMGTVTAGGTVDFELACRLPEGAADGDTFTAALNCSSLDDPNFEGTHDLSCGIQSVEFIPVPTMQPWALVLFSMLMLIAGGIGVRFFRAS